MAVSTTKRLQRRALSAALTSALILTATAAMAQETAPGFRKTSKPPNSTRSW